jgi:hypothetical protein
MKIYIASPYGDFEKTRIVMRVLEADGHVITHDWTKLADQFPEDNAPKELRKQHAFEDLAGISLADAIVVLTPEDPSRGCGMWIEMGAALMTTKRVLVVGPQRNRSVFSELSETYETAQEAREALRNR